MRIKLGVLAAVAVASFLPGCGGNSEDPPEPSTKREFVENGNAICDVGREKKDQIIEASFKHLSANPSKDELEALVLSVLPPLERAVEELGDLTAPDEDEHTVDNLIGEYEEALERAKAQPSKVLRDDPFDAADESAQQYGLTSCSL